MRVYDYECTCCNKVAEHFVKDHLVSTVVCPDEDCMGYAVRLMSAPRFKLDPNDSAGFPTAYAKWDKAQAKRAKEQSDNQE